MPKQIEYAFLSGHVYGKGVKPGNWKVYMECPDELINLDGYYGVAYRNINTNEIVIAHKGTSIFSLSDLVSDIQLAINKVPVQYNDLYEFVELVEQKVVSDGYDLNKISHTGHSLGGVLAQLASIAYDTDAVVFDCPGVQEILSTVGLSGSGGRITEYLTAPNIVNTINTHIGSMYRIYPKIQTGFLTSLGAKYSDFTLNQHNMDNIILSFNPTTDKPRVYSQPSSWPSSGLDWFKNYQLNPHYWNLLFDSRGWDRQKRRDFITAEIPVGLGSSYLHTTNTMPDDIHADGTTKDFWMTTLNRDWIKVSKKISNPVLYNYGGQVSFSPEDGISDNDIATDTTYKISPLDYAVVGESTGKHKYLINKDGLGRFRISDLESKGEIILTSSGFGRNTEHIDGQSIKCLTDLEGDPKPDMLVLNNHRVKIDGQIYDPTNGEYTGGRGNNLFIYPEGCEDESKGVIEINNFWIDDKTQSFGIKMPLELLRDNEGKPIPFGDGTSYFHIKTVTNRNEYRSEGFQETSDGNLLSTVYENYSFQNNKLQYGSFLKYEIPTLKVLSKQRLKGVHEVNSHVKLYYYPTGHPSKIWKLDNGGFIYPYIIYKKDDRNLPDNCNEKVYVRFFYKNGTTKGSPKFLKNFGDRSSPYTPHTHFKNYVSSFGLAYDTQIDPPLNLISRMSYSGNILPVTHTDTFYNSDCTVNCDLEFGEGYKVHWDNSWSQSVNTNSIILTRQCLTYIPTKIENPNIYPEMCYAGNQEIHARNPFGNRRAIEQPKQLEQIEQPKQTAQIQQTTQTSQIQSNNSTTNSTKVWGKVEVHGGRGNDTIYGDDVSHVIINTGEGNNQIFPTTAQNGITEINSGLGNTTVHFEKPIPNSTIVMNNMNDGDRLDISKLYDRRQVKGYEDVIFNEFQEVELPRVNSGSFNNTEVPLNDTIINGDEYFNNTIEVSEVIMNNTTPAITNLRILLPQNQSIIIRGMTLAQFRQNPDILVLPENHAPTIVTPIPNNVGSERQTGGVYEEGNSFEENFEENFDDSLDNDPYNCELKEILIGETNNMTNNITNWFELKGKNNCTLYNPDLKVGNHSLAIRACDEGTNGKDELCSPWNEFDINVQPLGSINNNNPTNNPQNKFVMFAVIGAFVVPTLVTFGGLTYYIFKKRREKIKKWWKGEKKSEDVELELEERFRRVSDRMKFQSMKKEDARNFVEKEMERREKIQKKREGENQQKNGNELV